MSAKSYQLVFIVGSEGSGNHMLRCILRAPKCVVRVSKEDHYARELMKRLHPVEMLAWDRYAEFQIKALALRQMRVIIDQLMAIPDYRSFTHFLSGRSAPLHFGDRLRPVLSDLLETFPDVKIIVPYRDPRASTASSARRGFNEHLTRSAVIAEEQLTYLSAQLSTFPESAYMVISYEDFCDRFEFYTEKLADFLGLDAQELTDAARKEDVRPGRNERWKEELDPASIEFLNKFFDDRRRQQWPLLIAEVI